MRVGSWFQSGLCVSSVIRSPYFDLDLCMKNQPSAHTKDCLLKELAKFPTHLMHKSESFGEEVEKRRKSNDPCALPVISPLSPVFGYWCLSASIEGKIKSAKALDFFFLPTSVSNIFLPLRIYFQCFEGVLKSSWRAQGKWDCHFYPGLLHCCGKISLVTGLQTCRCSTPLYEEGKMNREEETGYVYMLKILYLSNLMQQDLVY